MGTRYQKSEELLQRAEQSIPLGSQTFSKSRTALPYGVSPYFLERGRGSRVWDVDGNEYIDFVNALLCVSLGYGDPEVDAAVQEQMKSGVIFSLPHRLEMEVAESLIEIIPCAESVRFAKNGSDATSGAIRLARAYTGREHVAVCGYHGWQDWYIGSTARNLGVPQCVRDLTHTFVYNDIQSLERVLEAHQGKVAAVIMEPMNVQWPREGYLEAVARVARQHGALLIFDETITGFRFSLGGAQELFGVTPDLATFGKGLANGYPLSAVVGRREIMKLMEEIFFSGTFGGETISLAAARTVLHKLRTQPLLQHIHHLGKHLLEQLQLVIDQHDASHIFSLSGHPAWSFLNIRDTEGASMWQVKTFLMQEMHARGILTLGTHNISAAHSEEDIERLLAAYRQIIPAVVEGVASKNLAQKIEGRVLEPLFRVR
ncbi:aminotransferase class III-fold pyridoxal phosphate-dependent enzyme [Desulfurispirillum indicum]|uniref:aminotransferase class III-fold pyridoxal phosphate-dependent enzyme n=1 Tax=Desulfurispirillum indicum TaxID=936456 RepID=UPI001CFAC63D|nr:aminotransferase class III-fold pyridoxal phosphate-dependent enzyme [Desulfurispirillum indicum]UCZ57554.1 aminotransferase class III-fold pyridoxal phosphate-dependent enzyme [Desulfurispirillum indicum]